MNLLLNTITFLGAVFVWGICMLVCLWPMNDKPTSKSQYIAAAICTSVLAFIVSKLML